MNENSETQEIGNQATTSQIFSVDAKLALNSNENNPAVQQFQQKLSKIVFDVEARIKTETHALYSELQSQMKAALQEQKECHEEEKEKLNLEIKDLKDCIDSQDSMLAFKQRILENMMGKFRQQQSLLLCSKAFCKWKVVVENKKREDYLMSIAIKHFETNLKRKAFQWWLAQLKSGWKNRMEVKAHLEVIEMQKRIVNLYEARIQSLEENLSEANRKINTLQPKSRMDYPSFNVNPHYSKKVSFVSDKPVLADEFREKTSLRLSEFDVSLCPDCCLIDEKTHPPHPPLGRYMSYDVIPAQTFFNSSPSFVHGEQVELPKTPTQSPLKVPSAYACHNPRIPLIMTSRSPSRPQSAKMPRDKKIV